MSEMLRNLALSSFLSISILKIDNVYIGCHSHKKNKYNINVCSTNIDNELDSANCVSCHMPKVKGSVSNMHETKGCGKFIPKKEK